MSARRPRNVVKLPSRPSYVVGGGEPASIVDATARFRERRCEELAAICVREMLLMVDLMKARRERKRMIRQINRLYRMQVDEAHTNSLAWILRCPH
jgi:hypothetical protein